MFRLEAEMLDVIWIIKAGGYIGLFSIVFAESGLFLGFFLPGDSLLFTAGFLASQGFLDIIPLATITFIAAILGDSFGYAFGKKVGPSIFNKEESLFFKKEYLEKSRDFYSKHGKKTIILARFIPFVRTFAPILAGVGRMDYKDFLTYNIIGAAVWAIGLTVLGFTMGNVIPDADRFVIPIVLLIIFISLIPPAIRVFKLRFKKS